MVGIRGLNESPLSLLSSLLRDKWSPNMSAAMDEMNKGCDKSSLDVDSSDNVESPESESQTSEDTDSADEPPRPSSPVSLEQEELDDEGRDLRANGLSILRANRTENLESEHLDEEFGRTLEGIVLNIWNDMTQQVGGLVEGESFVSMAPATFYRRIRLNGHIALSTKRLFFQGSAAIQLPTSVLKRGRCSMHSKHKSYSDCTLELQPRVLVAYEYASDFTKPKEIVRLAEITKVDHDDSSLSKSLKVEYRGSHATFLKFSSAEAAKAWHTAIRKAILTQELACDKFAIAVPLSKMSDLSRTTCLDFMVLLRFSFSDDSVYNALSKTVETFGPRKRYLFNDIAQDGNPSLFSGIVLALHTKFSFFLSDLDSIKSKPAHTENLEPIVVYKEADSSVQEDWENALDDSISSKRQEIVDAFGLYDDPNDLKLFDAYLVKARRIPKWGTVCVTQHWLCFYRRKTSLHSDTKLRIPLHHVNNVTLTSVLSPFSYVGLQFSLQTGSLRFDLEQKCAESLLVTLKSFAVQGESAQSLDAAKSRFSFKELSKALSWVGQSIPTSREDISQLPSNLASGVSTGISSASQSISSQMPSSLSETVNMPSNVAKSTMGGLSSAASGFQSFAGGLAGSLSNTVSSFVPSPQSTLVNSNVDKPYDPFTEAMRLEAYITSTQVSRGLSLVEALNEFQEENPTSQPENKLHVVCLTIGSRGDVQPYISLGLVFKALGHHVTIASHPEYASWVESFGLSYKGIGGDPSQLMELMVSHDVGPSLMIDSVAKYRQWFRNLLIEAWGAAQGANLLIEAPQAFAGEHIAEALDIPYFRCFTMPWTRTKVYPQGFSPMFDLGETYNELSYVIYDSVMWKFTAGQINQWRQHTLGIPPTSLENLSYETIPWIYSFSTAVVPRPDDWADWIAVTGYWFLDNSDGNAWQPPEDLDTFMKAAREAKKPLVYIGFGSIVVNDADQLSMNIKEGVEAADVYAIVAKGWSSRGSSSAKDKTDASKMRSDRILSVSSVPHAWLFPRVDAAIHHGGSGTTGASLRAGIPTGIHPFFGDQPFWASRVRGLGAGVQLSSLSASSIADAIKTLTRDSKMKARAKQTGIHISTDSGPETAVAHIFRYINYAQRNISRIKAETEKKHKRRFFLRGVSKK